MFYRDENKDDRGSADASFLSGNFTRVYQSHVPNLPSAPLFGAIDTFDSVLDSIASKCHYLPNGDHVEGERRLFPEDIDWGDSEADDLLGVFSGIMETTDMFVSSHEALSEAGRTLNAPFITALKAYGPSLTAGKDILILCAGNGEDLNRISHSEGSRAKSVTLIGASDLNGRARVSLGGIPTKWYSQYLHSLKLKDDVDSDAELGDFDVVLCHQGLHHILATHEGEEAMRRIMRYHLRDGGRLIADKMDLVGLRGMVLPDAEAGRSIWLDSYDPDSGAVEGTAYIGVGGRVWSDPVLSDRRLFNLSQEWGVKVQTLNGKGIFMGNTLHGRPLNPPSTVARAAERSEIRAVTYIEAYKDGFMSTRIIPTLCPLSTCDPTGKFKWERKLSPPDHIIMQLNFRVVKGVVVGPRDLWNLSPVNSMFSNKSDGCTGKVIVTSGCAWLKVDHYLNGNYEPLYYISSSIARKEHDILKLQVEVFHSSTGVVTTTVVDPLHMGPFQPLQFAARVSQYHHFLREYPNYSYILPIKRWYSSWEEAASVSQEGVVIMNMNTPPPVNDALSRACHYVKRQLTIDVKTEMGEIAEAVFDPAQPECVGKIIRIRRDKLHPNSPESISKLKAALPFSMVSLIFGILGSEIPPFPRELMIEQALRYISGFKSRTLNTSVFPTPQAFFDAQLAAIWLFIHRSRQNVPPLLVKSMIQCAAAFGIDTKDPHNLLQTIDSQPLHARRNSRFKSAS